MSGAFTVVYRSMRRVDCDERAFMLAAVGIAGSVGFDGQQFLLEVDSAEAERASEQLGHYELERRVKAPPPPIPASHPRAWVGCVGYAGILLGVGLAISNGIWRLDAFDTGELDAGRVQSGQWWRAWTALTLHLDAAHLASNLGAGIWFGYLAARQLGNGHAWLLILVGAAAANLLEALLGPASHRSVGASTAVFAALGLLAAHSWRLRYSRSQRWAARWAPLVGGVVLLGLTGTGGDSGDGSSAGVANVDIVAHLCGFVTGVSLGALAAQTWTQGLLRRVPQWLTGTAALASIALAWSLALRS
jgi:membrane associated rhomboid family serine protease